jgi:hypothetical protein
MKREIPLRELDEYGRRLGLHIFEYANFSKLFVCQLKIMDEGS